MLDPPATAGGTDFVSDVRPALPPAAAYFDAYFIELTHSRMIDCEMMSSPRSPSRTASESIAWTIGRRIGMVIVLVLAFLLSATVTIYTLFRSGDTRVPNVIGKPSADALKLAEKAGLRVKVQTRIDSSVPADTVIETRPGPNSSVKKDSSLTIVVSSGPTTIKSQTDAIHSGEAGLWSLVGTSFHRNRVDEPLSR